MTKPSGSEFEHMKMKPIDDPRAPGAAGRLTRREVKYLIFPTSSSTMIVLENLAKNVATRLGERAFCVVFEDDLERCWPSKRTKRAEREKEIQFFAKTQGWTAAILTADSGTRAIFRKLDQIAANYEGASTVSA